jgi:superfamily II DNA/RNA helicase
VPHSPEDYVHRIGRTGRAGLPGEAISLVSPEDHEGIAAIERLIKKRIDRVLVAGFQPGGTTMAPLMSSDNGRRKHHDRQPEQKREPRHEPRREPQPAKKPADPIFSAPYEPGTAPPAPPKAESPQQPQQSKRKQPQVAALLGGLKRA